MLKRIALIAALAASAALPAAAADEVTFALNWLVSGKNAGYFVANEKGFYKEAGMDVTISRGSGSGDTIKRVAVGQSVFGLADTASVISAIANDETPVKLTGLVFSKSSVAILYVEQSGIHAPKDLAGKKLARSAAGASVNMYPGFLKANSLDRSTIQEVVVNSSSFLPMLLSKQADAVLDQSSYLGRYHKGAQGTGLTIKPFRFADYGFDLYGDGIIATSETLKGKGDLVRRFMAATLKGNAWAFEHPDEAIEILRKTNPEIDQDVGKAELIDTKELAIIDETRQHGLGWIDHKHMEQTRDAVTEALALKRKVPVEDIYTLDFLPKKG